MKRLAYYRVRALSELRDGVRRHLEWYYEPTGRSPWTKPRNGLMESRLTMREKLATKLMTRNPPGVVADIEGALIVSGSLVGLSRRQAASEQMWAYLCHCECPRYVSARWLSKRPASDDDAARKVVNHFFAVGNRNRALIRDNGLSRLWWLGTIAREVDGENPRRFLEILLHRQDVRSALIERASLSMNRQVLSCIYMVMREHWEGDRRLFARAVFRSWMVSLNRVGGVLLLDALPEEAVVELCREEAERALAEGGPEGEG